MDPLFARWRWNWKTNQAGEADCGIVAEPLPGHGYSICRCPRYVKEEQWRKYAKHICDLHNATLSL